MMKRLLPLLALLLCVQPAHGAVTTAGNYYSASTTCGASTAITPGSGDDIVLQVLTFTSGATYSTVADSLGATVTTDVPFAVDPTYNVGFGAFRVHGASASSQHITVTFTGAVNCYAWLVDTGGVFLFDQVATFASGTASPFQTNALTPTQNGALLLTAAGIPASAATLSSWQNSFIVFGQSRTTGSPNTYGAYLIQGTKSSVYAAATLSTPASWSGILLDYVPQSGGPTASQAASGFFSEQ